MNENKIMKQFTTIFSLFMVFFYLGAGAYLIFFFKNSTLDPAVLAIIGSTFIFYGIYRAFRTYHEIIEVFFTKDKDNE
ncbi:MAG: hypothetical protein LLG13_14380 [Bacteroidales bacterium]|nr:hypothetical protein [Bacteroidales bacterium]